MFRYIFGIFIPIKENSDFQNVFTKMNTCESFILE